MKRQKLKSPHLKTWREAFYLQRWLLLTGVVYLLTLMILAVIKGAKPEEFSVLLDCLELMILIVVSFFGLLAAYFFVSSIFEVFKNRKKRLFSTALARFDEKINAFINGERLIHGCVGLIVVFMAGAGICIGKSLIKSLTTYHWDAFLAKTDHFLHFGHYPYEFIMPLVKTLHIAGFMNGVYIVWFLVMFGVTGFCLFCDRDHQRRMRYLWTYLLSWIIAGTVLATFFASAGPIYFHDFNPGVPDPFAPLIAHLKNVNETTSLNVITLSKALLEMTRGKQIVDINAISAMPSMHIAIAWLMVCYGWSVNRTFGAVMAVYFIFIMAGSVYLAWHYAVDGYAAIAITSILWRISGWRLAGYKEMTLT